MPDYFVNSSVGKFSIVDKSEEDDYAPFMNYEEEGANLNRANPRTDSFVHGQDSNHFNFN